MPGDYGSRVSRDVALFADVEQGFMPWLMDCVEKQLETNLRGRLVLDGILRDVVNQRLEAYDRLDVSQDDKVDQNSSQTGVRAEDRQTEPEENTESYQVRTPLPSWGLRPHSVHRKQTFFAFFSPKRKECREQVASKWQARVLFGLVMPV